MVHGLIGALGGAACPSPPCISGRITASELALRDVPAPAERAGMPDGDGGATMWYLDENERPAGGRGA